VSKLYLMTAFSLTYTPSKLEMLAFLFILTRSARHLFNMVPKISVNPGLSTQKSTPIFTQTNSLLAYIPTPDHVIIVEWLRLTSKASRIGHHIDVYSESTSEVNLDF